MLYEIYEVLECIHGCLGGAHRRPSPWAIFFALLMCQKLNTVLAGAAALDGFQPGLAVFGLFRLPRLLSASDTPGLFSTVML